MHNIGLNLFVFQNINFIPPTDINNEIAPQQFEVTINNVNNFVLPVVLPESIEIVYSTDYFTTENSISLTKNGNKYIGELQFDTPQHIRYRIEYIDANTGFSHTITRNKG